MIIMLIILIACNALIIYSIFWELNKRRRLGVILMKVKFSFIIFLLITILCLGGAVIILTIMMYKFRQFQELTEKLLFGIMESVYLLILAKCFIRTVYAGELREKGITLSRGVINYSDIRKLDWLNETKIEIKFAVPIFSRIFKEKWTVKGKQVTQLKEILQEKYFDAF